MSVSDSPSPVSSRPMSPLANLDDVSLSRYLHCNNPGLSISLDCSPVLWSPTEDKPIVQRHRRLSSSSSSVTAPSPVSLTFDSPSLDESEYSWNLIPYNVPWGPSYYAYEAGTLPGPEGTCVFLRSPTPIKNQRTSQACKQCRERKAKCSGTHPACDRCLTRGHVCQYVNDNKRARRVTSNREIRQKTGNSHQDSVVAPQASVKSELNPQTSIDTRESSSCGSTDIVLTQSEQSPEIYSPVSIDFRPEDSLDGVNYPPRDFGRMSNWYSSMHEPSELQWQSVHSPRPSRYPQATDLVSNIPACGTFDGIVPPLYPSSSTSSSAQSTRSPMEFPIEYSASHMSNGGFDHGSIQTNHPSGLSSDSTQSGSSYGVYAHRDLAYGLDPRLEFGSNSSQVYGSEQPVFSSTAGVSVFSGNYQYPYSDGASYPGA